ncbi:hypothetical protein ACJ41O_012565 [Fusarium nematophilum]
MGVSGIVARGTYYGIGTRDAELNGNLQSDGRRYLWYFQVTYCCSLLFLKGSICALLLRIAVVRTHRIIIWATLVFSTLSTTTVIIGLFLICHPISAAWGRPGKCSPTVVIASLGYLVSAGAVVTDFSCAILPGFMVYKANMKMSTKISITIVLGLGLLASIATLVRLPYVKYYTRLDNYLYNVANIVLWSIFESGIGIIAGSLPALRRLLRKGHQLHDRPSDQSPARDAPFAGSNQATITNNTTTGLSNVDTAAGSETVGDGDQERWDDASPGRKIFVTVDLEMQSLERPAPCHRSHESIEELVS